MLDLNLALIKKCGGLKQLANLRMELALYTILKQYMTNRRFLITYVQFSLVIAGLLILVGCSSQESRVDNEQKVDIKQAQDIEYSEISSDQQAAMDALNHLQVNTQYHLHSTFVGAETPCFPPDTTFLISKDDLHSAMTRFVNKYYDGGAIGLEQ